MNFNYETLEFEDFEWETEHDKRMEENIQNYTNDTAGGRQ
jgi:hypothetical protein